MATALRTCLITVASDTNYVNCFFDTGLSDSECNLQCTSASAASNCCTALSNLKKCEINNLPELVECKELIDDLFSNAISCGLGPSDILALVVVFLLFSGAVLLWYLQKRATKMEDELDFLSKLAKNTRQVHNLMWKNFTLKLKHKGSLITENILPLVVAGALVLIANLDAVGGAEEERRLVGGDTIGNVSTSFSTRNLQSGCTTIIVGDIPGQPNEALQSFYNSVQPIIGIFFILAYIKFVASISSSMVLEKESKIREGMRMMGLKDFPLIISYYLTYFIIFTPLSFAMALELKFGNVFPQAAVGTLFFFFWIFGWAIVSFCYMITPFFNRSRTVSIAATLIWLLAYFPFYNVEPVGAATQTIAALSAPVAFGLGINFLAIQAQRGTVLFYGISVADDPILSISVEKMTTMLFIDTLLYLFLGWYFDKVVPQNFGIRQPYFFLFKKSYWYGEKKKKGGPNAFYPLETTRKHHSTDDEEDEESASHAINPADVEPVSDVLLQQEENGGCVQIHKLRKVFPTEGGEKVAVNNLSLTLYSGQITALLGHNGAGKTTALSILSGLIPPSGGDAFIFGKSIRTQMPEIRRSMGICPQHDVLYDELTVHDHLRFFATIKEIPPFFIQEHITKIVEEVGLTEKIYTISKSLSGGQKRKLSVAIALIGDSRIVFLDEPTSGMDPYSRRFTWNVLRKNRPNRVIVLTTHFMDEADLLGDRIAIIAQGELCCAGSSLFLKNRYGAGYNLTIVKAAHCDVAAVLHGIQSVIHDARLLSDVGTEVIYQLPTSASRRFPRLFSILEKKKREIGILEYGISVTTLEAVFLRIAKDREARMTEGAAYRRTRDNLQHRDSHIVPSFKLRPSQWVQYRALLRKRYQYAKRDKKGLCFSLVIPVLFLVVLAFLPEIKVASYLPLYRVSGIADQLNYETCRNDLDTNAETNRCAFASIAGPDCNRSCQSERVECKDNDCFGDFEKDANNPAAPYCPPLDSTVIPSQQTCQENWFSFCSLGIVDCDAQQCCNNENINSPYFPCSQCQENKWACYTDKCLRKADFKLQGTINVFIASLIIVIAFAFVPASIIMYIVKEKNEHQNAKLQQLVSGVGILPYWASFYTWDIINLTPPLIVALAFLPGYGSFQGVDGIDMESFQAGAILLILYALSIVPLTYIISFRYEHHSDAQTGMLVFSFMSGAALAVFSYISRLVELDITDGFSLAELDSQYLHYIYLLFPGFALQDGIFQIGVRKFGQPNHNQFFPSSCAIDDSCWESFRPGCCTPGAYELQIAGRNMIYLLAESILLVWYVLYKDRKLNDPSKNINPAERIMSKEERLTEQVAVNNEDPDVIRERMRVQNGQASHDNIRIDSLRKIYMPKEGRKRVALHNLSLGIPAGECFGYLGINGAGKTTTMKILTGNVVPSSGNAFLGGLNVTTQQQKARQLIGYCPQFDALFDYLTVDEHLEFYAKVKGIKEKHIKRVVDDKVKQMDLTAFRDKLTSGLSGGNKRKVSAAIAIIGNPPIVFLDEPSTGMDPVARRKMWDVISELIDRGNCTVILTTHSMEECEALCSRIGILVSGRLQCVGSVQHLKSTFGQGYTIQLKMNPPSSERVIRMQTNLIQMTQVPGTFDEETNFEVSTEMVRSMCRDHPRRLELILQGEGSGWIFAQYLDAGEGYLPLSVVCSWWIQEDQAIAVRKHFATQFRNSKVIEHHGSQFTYQLPKAESNLAQLFSNMEQHKEVLEIAEYSVTETTLEQIFNNFAAGQEEETLTHGYSQPTSGHVRKKNDRSGNQSFLAKNYK